MKTPMRVGRQLGQAMVEMVVISLLTISLFLGIWYIGKFHDIQSTTIQAARYSAWERTARGAGYTDTTLQSQTRARLFSWNQNAYSASDGLPNGRAWGAQNAMWLDHASDQHLIAAPADVTVGTVSGPLPGRAASTVAGAFAQLDNKLATLTSGEPLPRGGAFTGTVKVKLANITALGAPMNALNLTLTETSMIVADNWDAGSPAQAAARTRSFTPSGVLRAVDGSIGTVIKSALALIEPSFNNFHPGQICPDVVPSDRLLPRGRVTNPPVYAGASPCF